MYKITIKGQALTDYKNLSELNGIDCQDNFAKYFDSDFTFKDDIKSGYMHFVFENKELWTVTEYISSRELSKEELDTLSNYTQGQWSDGIGEGFEQHPCYFNDDNFDDDSDEDGDVYISPWFFGQEVKIISKKLD